MCEEQQLSAVCACVRGWDLDYLEANENEENLIPEKTEILIKSPQFF